VVVAASVLDPVSIGDLQLAAASIIEEAHLAFGGNGIVLILISEA
jgi:hypothetical protein